MTTTQNPTGITLTEFLASWRTSIEAAHNRGATSAAIDALNERWTDLAHELFDNETTTAPTTYADAVYAHDLAVDALDDLDPRPERYEDARSYLDRVIWTETPPTPEAARIKAAIVRLAELDGEDLDAVREFHALELQDRWDDAWDRWG